MLRTSSYTICVDLPGDSGEVLLIHGYTGAYDKVSRRVATYIRSLEAGRPSNPLHENRNSELPTGEKATSLSEEAITVLKRRGYLTEKTVQEEQALFAKIATALHAAAMRRIPSYLLMLTYNCNLRCPYCYQDHLRTDSRSKLLDANMQPELVDRIFLAMDSLEADRDIPEDGPPPRHIKFYGGEPLLARNHPIVTYIIDKALALGKARISAVTNATQLHAYQDLLGPDKIASLQITLDGPRPVHDKQRVHVDGSGTFERIAQNISMALDRGVRISARVNVDRNNLAWLPELASEMVSRGWDRCDKFSAYAAPIGAANAKTSVEMTMSSWKLNRALAEMRQYPEMRVIGYVDDGLKNRLRRIFATRADPLPGLKSGFCGAHSNVYIFDPYGDVYACWERTGDRQLRIGHVGGHGEINLNAEVNQIWRSRTVISNPACHQCCYAFYCGGGCAARAHNRYHTYSANFCDDFVERFRADAVDAYLDFAARSEPTIRQEWECEV